MLDMIIRQVRTLNEEIFDIGIQQGKICQIAKTIEESAQKE